MDGHNVSVVTLTMESTYMQVLWGECIAGALYYNDFEHLAKQAGFADPRVLAVAPIDITDYELQKVVGNAKFFSITYRLFKLPGLLDPHCEDYGQVVRYKVGAKILVPEPVLQAQLCATCPVIVPAGPLATLSSGLCPVHWQGFVSHC